MINIDTRLVESGMINEKELWFLIHVVKRINVKRFCWPSNERLLEDTGWHIEKLNGVKKSLVKKGIISIIRRGDKSNIYRIHTKLMGIFVNCDTGDLMEVDGPDSSIIGKTAPLQFTENPQECTPEKPQVEVLPKEVLTNPQLSLLGSVTAKKIIEELNRVKASFGLKGQARWTKERGKLIEARLKEYLQGWRGTNLISELSEMFQHRCKVWKGTEFEKFVRVETLFRASKFIGYMEESQAQPDKDWTEQRQATPAPGTTVESRYQGLV